MWDKGWLQLSQSYAPVFQKTQKPNFEKLFYNTYPCFEDISRLFKDASMQLAQKYFVIFVCLFGQVWTGLDHMGKLRPQGQKRPIDHLNPVSNVTN